VRSSRNSNRFSDTFARRPGLPRLTGGPDRRAWMTTAFVATFVAGAAVAVPVLTHLGGSDTVVSVDAPISLQTNAGTPTPVPTSTATVTATPRTSVATATVTVTAPGGKVTVIKPGTTVTLPPTTVTAPGPGANTVTATTTATSTTTATVTTKVTEPGKQAAETGTGKGQQLQAMQGTTMAMKSEGSKRCIDVKDGRAGAGNDGTPLQVWDCNSGSNQTWTFNDDGTVRSLGQCMDLAWGSIAENTPVQLVACNGNAAQQFRITQKNQLVNPAAEGKCVTSDGGDNGGRLFLRTCTGAANQVWQKP
jgi:hypothetical protein